MTVSERDVSEGGHGRKRGSPADRSATTARQEEDDDGRPQQVELLLHREGPQVPKWDVSGEPVSDESPVRNVEERGQHTLQRHPRRRPAAGAAAGHGGRPWRVSTGREHDGQPKGEEEAERGQQAQRPAREELRQRHPPRRCAFLHEEAGDEEATQREEDEHRHLSDCERQGQGVRDEHDAPCQTPDPVERRPPAEAP